MKKNDLIKNCRYYNGETVCPYSHGDISWFWDMERVYVEHDERFVGEGDYYQRIGGKMFPGIPASLLFVMFTSWAKYATPAKEHLEEFYKKIDLYLDFVSERIPKDRLPD